MRAALTTAQKATLSKHPHRLKLSLLVHVPAVIFAAQVNNIAAAQGDMTIPYDTVTTGAYGAVIPGHTLVVGSTSGASDLGRVRIKAAADATKLYVAANSDVQWADNVYLSVLDEFALWVKFPRTTQSPVVHYKDYDTSWSYHTERENPVAIMGPPAVARLDGTGHVTVKFVGDQSYSVAAGKTIDTYSWTFTGPATPNTSSSAGTTASPVEIEYDTAGTYRASLEVTDVAPNQTAHTGRRPVFILPATGGCYEEVEISDPNGDYESGGWSCTLRAFGDADAAEFPDGAMVVLFAETETFGADSGGIGGYPHRENVKFVGWIVDESTTVQYAPDGQRYVEFRAETIDGLLKIQNGYPVDVNDDSTPADWTQMRGLNIDRAAYYLFKWHSTLHDIADVHKSGLTTAVLSYSFPGDSLYGQVDSFLRAKAFARCVSGRCSEIWLQRDPQFEPAATRTAVVTVAPLDDYLREDLTLPRKQRGACRYIELQGDYYNPSTGQKTVYIAEAPGPIPRQDGTDERQEGAAFVSQADANEMAGLALAEKNLDFRDIPIKLRGNHGWLDIAPQGWCTLSLAAAGNKRGIVWTNQKLIPRRVSWAHDPQAETLLVDASFDKESTGPSGVTGTYPTEPPEELPPDVPEPPPPIIPPVVPPEDVTPQYAVTCDVDTGPWWTNDYGATWENRTASLTATNSYGVMVKRGWQTMQGSSDPAKVILVWCGKGFIRVSYDSGLTWIDRTPNVTAQPTLFETSGWVEGGDAPAPAIADIVFKQVECPNDTAQTFYALAEWQNATSKWRGWLCSTSDMGLTWTTEPVGAPGAASTPWEPGDPIYATGFSGTYSTNSSCTLETEDSGNVVGAPDSAGLKVKLNNYSGSNQNVYWAVDIDMGGDIGYTLASTHIAITAKGIVGDEGNVLFSFFNRIDISADGTTWVQQCNGPGFGTGSYSDGGTDIGAGTATGKFRYVRYAGTISMRSSGAPGYVQHSGLIDAVTVTNADSYDKPVRQNRPLGLAVDFETGHRTYITEWDGSSVSIVLDSQGIVVGDPADIFTTLYAATEAQVDAQTRFMFPRVVYQPTVSDWGDIVYLFGTDASGNGYVGESVDLGETITDRSGGLTTSLSGKAVTALLAKGDGAGKLSNYYAFGNDKVYKETAWTWDAGNTAPLTPGPLGVSVGQDGSATLIAVATTDEIQIAPEPYTSWTDKTGSGHGTDTVQWVIP